MLRLGAVSVRARELLLQGSCLRREFRGVPRQAVHILVYPHELLFVHCIAHCFIIVHCIPIAHVL